MSKKKNKAGNGKGAKALAFLKDLETKGNVKHSAIETAKSLAVGLLGAGLGAAFGKPSLAVGIVATGVGHYLDSRLVTSAGIGMIASGGYQIGSGVSGAPVGGIDGVKERVKAFGANIKDRLYLDKIIKPKTTEGTEGVGDVEYFKYPNKELDMGSLNDIENEIAQSGVEYQKRQMSGSNDEMEGIEEERLY